MKEYKLEKGKLYVREAERISAGFCPYCGEEVWVSEGQAVTYRKKRDIGTGKMVSEPTHRKCRKLYARHS